jgi:hypothetical protein
MGKHPKNLYLKRRFIMENEIMNNENVMEEATDIVSANSGNGLKALAGVGLTVLAGVVIYKVGKKIAAKIKAKRDRNEPIEAEYEEHDVNDSEEEI